MGRGNFYIKLIKDRHMRQCNFSKREKGLFKKAYEFAVLSSKRVHVLLQGETPETEPAFFPTREKLRLDYQSIPVGERIGQESFVSGWEAHEPQDSPFKQAQPSLHQLGPDREPAAMNSPESGAGSEAGATVERNVLFSPRNGLPATYRDIFEVLDSLLPARSSSCG